VKPRLDERTDPYFVGSLAGALVFALRALEQEDATGAKRIMRGSLNEFFRSEIGRDPELRRVLGVVG
jgi:hypothetical protein